MLNNKKRGLLASAGALVTAVALAFGGAVAAQAAPTSTMPDSAALIITKLEQPEGVGAAASGLEQTVAGAKPIEGVSFEAYRVPLTQSATTNEGQSEIAKTTLAEAQALLAAKPATGADKRTGVTGDDGKVIWKSGAAGAQGESLQAGLWLVRETGTPADVVAAGDFIVAAPLTDPTEGGRDKWLTDIFVYPKNQKISATKSVSNAEQLLVGDVVTWTVSVKNPSVRDHAMGGFIAAGKLQITDELAEGYLALAGGPDAVTAELTQQGATPIALTPGAAGDFVASLAGNTVTVDFTEAGLAKLAENPGFDVAVQIPTTVLQQGEIKNIARFTTSDAEPKPTDPAVIKYGSYALIKQSSDPTNATLAGAEFMVFTDEATAIAAVNGDTETGKQARAAAVKPPVTAAGYDATTGVWTTDDTGRVDITGLRYSNWADGKTAAGKAVQSYWLVETKALKDHQLLAAPVRFVVDENSGDAATQTEIIVNERNRNGFVLPLTGGSGTIMLTVAGIALLAVVLVAARRRRHAAE